MTTLILPLTTKQTGLSKILEKARDLKAFDINFLILCEKRHKIVTEFENFKQITDRKFDSKTEINLEKSKKVKINKSNQGKININLCVFPNGTKEEAMINSSIKELPENGFILLRNDVKEINTNLIEKILAESQTGGDIIMAKKIKKRNFLSMFFSKILVRLYGLIFNFNFYSGDIGVQYFNALALSVMKETNPVLLTKLNKWLAINIRYIDFDVEPINIKQKNYGKNKLMLCVYFCCTVVFVCFIVLLSSVLNFSFIIWLFVAFLSLIFAILIIVTVFRIYLVYKLGDIRAETAYPTFRRELWISMKNLQKI